MIFESNDFNLFGKYGQVAAHVTNTFEPLLKKDSRRPKLPDWMFLSLMFNI